MPFTFAHPAIVLPFDLLPKRVVSLTALVTGSMLPDFEYFLRLKIMGIYGHSLSGLFWFDLPLGLLVYFTWQIVVKNILIDKLPAYFNRKFSIYKNSMNSTLFTQSTAVVIACLLVGSASHIFWDSFTHKQGFFTEHFIWLTSTIRLAGHAIFVFKLLQHCSTLLGFIAIGLVVARLPMGEATKQKIRGPVLAFYIYSDAFNARCKINRLF